MTRRPMCLLCLFLMVFLCLGDWLGFPLIRGNPLPESLQEWVGIHPQVSICGEVETSEETEYSQSIYLKQTYLIYNSKKFPIKNVRVFLKEKQEVPVGAVLLLSGKLTEVEKPRNEGEFDSRQYYACRHIYYFLKDAEIVNASAGYSRYGQLLADLKSHFADVLAETTGEAAGVFTAIALGDKSVLEEETKLRYQMAGILHILAISGLHISILGVGLYNLLKKIGFGIWPAGMISLVIMLQYGMMTGGTVSTMRAVCMFLISVGAKILGRIYDMMTALAAAAILILVESPAYLYDGGFLLSFTAVVGAGAVLPKVTKIVGKRKKKSVLSGRRERICGFFWDAGEKLFGGFLASLSVQLVSLPVMLWFYGEVSLAGVFLNLLVLPTVGVVLASAVGAALGGSVLLVLGTAAGVPGRVILWVYEELCRWIGKMPFCTWTAGRPKLWQIAVYYVILWAALKIGEKVRERMDSGEKPMFVRSGSCERYSHEGFSCSSCNIGKCFAFSNATKRNSGQDRTAAERKHMAETICRMRGGLQSRIISYTKLAGAGFLCVGLLCAGIGILGYRPGGTLEITCLDVGQGDASVVEFPSGQVILVDGGSSNKSETGRYQILPYLKCRGISYVDAIFISHTDGDHINGISQLLEWMGEGLTALRVGSLVLPAWEAPPEEWQELAELAGKAGVKVETAGSGDVFRLKDACVEVLSPAEGALGNDVNEDAVVLQVRYKEFQGLFTGDIGAETEKKLLNELEDVDFLKVAHHGSRYSSCEEFLEKISPEIAVISCSATNNPTQIVIQV